MKRLLFACLILLAISSPAFGETDNVAYVNAMDLLNNAGKYSHTEIEFRGEAIGDIMKRGSHGWVNVNDGTAAIGVWAPVELLDNIKTTGDYMHKGDIIVVKGVFNQGCAEHGGDTDIHATKITVSESGSKRTHSINNTKLLAAELLPLVAAALYFINRKKAKK